PTQASVFFHLLEGETSPSAIAHHMGVDASNLSRLVAALEKRGLVERRIDLDNRTRITLCLTGEGERLACRVAPHAAELRERIVACLDDDELRTFEACLEKVSRALQPEADSPDWERLSDSR
ncbi:MAG: MarR family winged helix-turn-helix transcriptional regulator, partial [Holophagales bacterium]|nr:MarR family winged helix-turn-helix transcriptional regulator [Holophagales bacterium]